MNEGKLPNDIGNVTKATVKKTGNETSSVQSPVWDTLYTQEAYQRKWDK